MKASKNILHFPWSSGYVERPFEKNQLIDRPIVITEKLFGADVALGPDRMFYIKQTTPPRSLSFMYLTRLYETLKIKGLSNMRVLGTLISDDVENFVIHTVKFGENGTYQSWESVKQYSSMCGYQFSPVLFEGTVSSEEFLKDLTEELCNRGPVYGKVRKAVVVRAACSFEPDKYDNYVMQYERKI